APGRPPMRLGRQGLRHEIEAVRAPGMASENARHRHPAARPQAEAADGFVGIFRAAWQMPAARAEQRRQRVAVNSDQPATEKPWQPRDRKSSLRLSHRWPLGGAALVKSNRMRVP